MGKKDDDLENYKKLLEKISIRDLANKVLNILPDLDPQSRAYWEEHPEEVEPTLLKALTR